MNGKNTPMVSG